MSARDDGLEYGFAGIHHASVLVADTGRALAFYRDLLGLELDTTRPELSFGGAWLNVGSGQQIHLLELPNPDPVRARPAHGGRDRHTALRVHGLDRIAAALQDAGVAVTWSRSGRKAVFCRDPDGNTLELIESDPAQA
jgi:glyoxylase I family protein